MIWYFGDIKLLFSLGLGRSQSPSLRPKMNTKVAFSHHPQLTHLSPTTTTKLNLLTSSRHSRRLKLGIQLNQTKPNPNLKNKISQHSFKKSLKNIFKKVLKDWSFRLNTLASRLVSSSCILKLASAYKFTALLLADISYLTNYQPIGEYRRVCLVCPRTRTYTIYLTNLELLHFLMDFTIFQMLHEFIVSS